MPSGRVAGAIASTAGVNLRPVNDADTILLGAGNGFSLASAELAMIDAPLLVIGSAQHAGAIRVTAAVDWDGDLTLQNEGGAGGIDLQAAIDVGDNILTLASGGDIGQASAGAITAHSLLAIADGDVSLTAAQNNVASSSVAGSAGGDFAYEDVDELAIGEVSSFGFSRIDNAGLVALSASGIAAEGNVLVATASGNLILGADVSGTRIDLVAADLFLNPASASLTASEGWRIFARTPDGEERGGLQGDGQFDVFGCTFGQENCLGIGDGNQFIYQEQRFRRLRTNACTQRGIGLFGRLLVKAKLRPCAFRVFMKISPKCDQFSLPFFPVHPAHTPCYFYFKSISSFF